MQTARVRLGLSGLMIINLLLLAIQLLAGINAMPV